MELTQEELNSALMQKLKAHFEEKLKHFRRQNDQPRIYEETVAIRAKISACKDFLKLDPEWKE